MELVHSQCNVHSEQNPLGLSQFSSAIYDCIEVFLTKNSTQINDLFTKFLHKV